MSTKQITYRSVYGLELNSNSFKAREGSLERATNIVVSQDNIYKKCRGDKVFVDPNPTVMKTLTEYGNKLIGLCSDKVQVYNQSTDTSYSSTSTLSNGTNVVVAIGSNVSKSRSVESNGNLYFSTDNGPLKLESTSSNVLKAGVAQALDLDVYRTINQTIETYLPAGSQTGYRVLFGRKDANQNLVLGAPSQLATVSNSLSTATAVSGPPLVITTSSAHGISDGNAIWVEQANGTGVADGLYYVDVLTATTFSLYVDSGLSTIVTATGCTSIKWGRYKYCKIQFSVPADVASTEFIYQIYRTEASAASTIPPDESTLQLVDELNITAADIAAGFISYYDTTPDLLRGSYLYTNPNTGEPRGEAEANLPPPMCKDISSFKNHVIYAGCTSPYRLSLSVISSSSTSMPNASTIVIQQSAAQCTFTSANVDTGTEQITITSHGLLSGDPVRLTTTGALPTGLSTNTSYFVIKVSSNVIKLASSYANAVASTAINLTGVGSGTSSVFRYNTYKAYAGGTKVGNKTVQATSTTFAANTVTITYNGHGFSNGDVVAIIEAVDSNESETSQIPKGVYTVSNAAANTFDLNVGATYPNPASLSFSGLNDASGNNMFYAGQSDASGSTVSTAIAETAKYLATSINRDPSRANVAFYVSGSTDVPGKLSLQSTGVNQSFYIQAGSSTITDSFLPAMPTSGSTLIGIRDDELGMMYVAKQGQPEAVPLYRRVAVGTRSSPILRVKPLRDSFIILKPEGAFRLNGSDFDNFSVTILDSTVAIQASDSVAVLNNNVFCLTQQGVVAISETAAAVVSRSIEPLLTAILGRKDSNGNVVAETYSHAYSYESERLYVLATSSPTTSTTDTVYVYNQLTNAWTQFSRVFADGFVKPSEDKFYIVDADGKIRQERKNQNRLDYCGDEFSTTVTSTPSTTTAALTVVGSTAAVGDIFVVSGIINRIASISGSTLTFSAPISFSTSDTGTLYKSITSTIRTSPIVAGDPSRWKHFSEFQCQFRNSASASKLTVSFQNDSTAGSSDTVWTSQNSASGWGNEGWGNFGWGQETGINSNFDTSSVGIMRTYVAFECQRGTFIQMNITHDDAGENLMLQSMSLTARTYSQRVSR